MYCSVKGTTLGGIGGSRYEQGSSKSLAALSALADKLKSHGQIMIKITFILSSSAGIKSFDTYKDFL